MRCPDCNSDQLTLQRRARTFWDQISFMICECDSLLYCYSNTVYVGSF